MALFAFRVDRRGIGLVVVTHNPALAGRICTRVVDLRDINHIEREQEKYMT